MDSISERFGSARLAKAIWWLTNGSRVSSEVSKLVIVNPDITSVGDSLFRNAPGQTYRSVK
jgi:hypothetical protein